MRKFLSTLDRRGQDLIFQLCSCRENSTACDCIADTRTRITMIFNYIFFFF